MFQEAPIAQTQSRGPVQGFQLAEGNTSRQLAVSTIKFNCAQLDTLEFRLSLLWVVKQICLLLSVSSFDIYI